MSKIVYLFDGPLNAFTCSYVCQPDPLETGKYIEPAKSLDVAPEFLPHSWPVADGDVWIHVPDYRGTVYFLADGSRHEITDLAVEPPVNALDSAPVTADQLLAAVYAERDRRWRAGFPVQIGGVTTWFHSDEFSLTQHLGLKDKARDVLAAGGAMSDVITIGGQPAIWSTMGGSQVTITAQVAFDLVEAAGVQQLLIFAASQAHEVAINADQYLSGDDVLTGWPAVFASN